MTVFWLAQRILGTPSWVGISVTLSGWHKRADMLERTMPMIMIPLGESKFLRPNTYSQGKLRSKVSREPSTSLGVNHGRLDLLVGSNLSVCEPKGRPLSSNNARLRRCAQYHPLKKDDYRSKSHESWRNNKSFSSRSDFKSK